MIAEKLLDYVNILKNKSSKSSGKVTLSSRDVVVLCEVIIQIASQANSVSEFDDSAIQSSIGTIEGRLDDLEALHA